jgi:hypothetical protein
MLAQLSLAFTTLLPGAMEVLERRRIAGTLLHGTCAPHEVEWSRRFLSDDRPGIPSDALMTSALLMGYEVYLKAAYLALAWLYECRDHMRRRSRGRRSLASSYQRWT